MTEEESKSKSSDSPRQQGDPAPLLLPPPTLPIMINLPLSPGLLLRSTSQHHPAPPPVWVPIPILAPPNPSREFCRGICVRMLARETQMNETCIRDVLDRNDYDMLRSLAEIFWQEEEEILTKHIIQDGVNASPFPVGRLLPTLPVMSSGAPGGAPLLPQEDCLLCQELFSASQLQREIDFLRLLTRSPTTTASPVGDEDGNNDTTEPCGCYECVANRDNNDPFGNASETEAILRLVNSFQAIPSI